MRLRGPAGRGMGLSCGLMFSLSVVFSGPGSAQAVDLEDQYKKKLAGAQHVSSSVEFGDQIGLRDGSLAFKATDVELIGTGPDIRIVRTATVHDNRLSKLPTANKFGAWDLEVPRIKTITANGSNYDRGSTISPTSPVGWQVAASDKNARCSSFTQPADVTYEDRSVEFLALEWWFGYFLVDTEGNEHKLLRRSASLPGSEHKIGTKDGWIVDCLGSTSNGEPGEAFLATAPDGTRYWFDYLTYTEVPGLSMPFEDMPPKGYTLVFTLHRRAAAMLVTRIEDRHGNWVRYSYTAGRVSSIVASDGRQLAIAGQAGITAISTGTGRTWTYGYADAEQTQLSTVTRPDGSSWRYEGNFAGNMFSLSPFKGCDQTIPGGTLNGTPRTLSVTSPAGARATFSLNTRAFGRSYVDEYCITSIYAPDIVMNPKLYESLAMTSKSVSGPGVSATWQYRYSDHGGSYLEDCASVACTTRVWTDVVEPDGSKTRNVFSNKVDQLENSLVRQEFYAPSGNMLRSRDIVYAMSGADGTHAYPWPLQYGVQPDNAGNYLVNERLTPVVQEVISENGAALVLHNTAFDLWGRPVSTARYSPWHSRADTVTYHDDLPRWIIGQIKSVTNDNTGQVVSRTEFDSRSLPYKTWQFGKLQQTLTYNGNGTVATAKDGKDNTTTLSSWKRGIAQSIKYADGTAASSTVNDDGWITATADENGYVTAYGYDPMGRLASVVHPGGDGISWNATTQAFEQVAAAEYGLQAGHWRQTVATGNARKVTYFDAFWRPVITHEFDAGSPDSSRYQRFSYDHAGRVTFASYPGQTDALSSGTWTAYDALGRVTSHSQDSELGLLTTLTEYLPGNQTRVTDPRGNQSLTGYQVFDQPAYDKPIWIQHPEQARTEIARDVFGNVLQITRGQQ